jgi:putative Mg2+ transporter-C (MgtC) family protein
MTDLELAARMLLSLLFGTLVGLERQWHHKNAGLKTNTLVAVGATTFTVISQLGFGPNTYLPQVAAGVVTGIGFIGGGVIMRRGVNVQGINSAATLWATASMGLSIGAGYYKLACLTLSLVLAIQFTQHWLANWIDKRSHFITPHVIYNLGVAFVPRVVEAIRSVWSVFAAQAGVSVLHYSETAKNDSEAMLEASLALSEARVRDLTTLTQTLAQLPGVRHAAWSEKKVEESDGDSRG